MNLTDNEQRILQELRDERDAWMQTHRDLAEQVKWARDRGMAKMSDSLRVARDHADRMHQEAAGTYDCVAAILNPPRPAD